ncbi:MAG: HAMP domain-containing protein [Alphaproteobacteria bacterium]|nr:HAMP domain-containing protein [Alphaproteobacteria bacterium]
MNFAWLKSILPKGIFGRTALILLLPVLTIQVVVSVVFIQRHFEGVTKQLTISVALELQYLINQINNSPNITVATRVIEDIAEPLDLQVTLIGAHERKNGDVKNFTDLTGASVILALHSKLRAVSYIDLSVNPRQVWLHVTTNKGVFLIKFSRARVSAANPHQLLVLMLVVSILITLISFIFLKNQVRPIRRLARAAEAFGKGRNLPYIIAGATEVRQAGQAFLDMRNRIERQIEQRTLMLSGVSHDLRTPLTRLKLGLSLVGDDAETHALVQDVNDMEQMLNEFLAFARGDSLEETSKIDPLELAKQVVSDARRGNGEVELVAPAASDEFVLVPMRENAVRRALDNLVNNGLRYGSKCRLSLTYAADHIQFTVEDNGPGISADYREKAVRPFERLDIARNQNRGTGVGLGLAIATDIASSHGGGLMLSDSDGMGGLRVEFRLPK